MFLSASLNLGLGMWLRGEDPGKPAFLSFVIHRFAHPLDSAPRLIMVELGLSLNVLSFKPA